MSRARLTRAVTFSASHRYWRRGWSAARNRARFGSAAGERPHEHEYRCELTVEGTIDPVTGMVADLDALDALLGREVGESLDGAFLNEVEDFTGDLEVPTTENIARVIWGRIDPKLPEGCTLVKVRVAEDPDLWAEYRGG